MRNVNKRCDNWPVVFDLSAVYHDNCSNRTLGGCFFLCSQASDRGRCQASLLLSFFFLDKVKWSIEAPEQLSVQTEQLRFRSKVSLSTFLYVTSTIRVSVVFQKLQLLLICHFHHISVLSFISNTPPGLAPLFSKHAVCLRAKTRARNSDLKSVSQS